MTQIILSCSRALLCLAVALSGCWAVLALWFRLPFDLWLRLGFAAGFALLTLAVIFGLSRPRRLRALATYALALATVITWWASLTPPATRNWSPDVERQVTGELNGSHLTLTNIRNFTWRSADDFDATWENRSYDLEQLQSLDLFMSYWSGKSIAHMIISFGFADGQQIAWSVEVRRERGGGFSPIADLFKANTLSLIAADERDVIGIRTNIRGEDVQLFRTNTSPETARALLLHYVATANHLADQPQWYNSLATNCTTVVLQMIRRIVGELPLDWRVLANGYLPSYAYDAGVLDSRLSLQTLVERGRITARARAHGLQQDYSTFIRQDVPSPGD
ncbi:DUF4105 domain-containing protein [Phaeobacter sp. 11ANDIMAR09]|uniref:Lnb N-terminal periplasmic domain-containing protein n=1 Tax=Phaeobacter sp. 11ANDIMAR09 TaxID=1225647 RepID=UPI0006C84A61|nr:DUF4105 domain-containing protein [Phaeobacter sp. 11ANDIMAR09]KPD11123.1 hypothetical protein AN476_17290 [Phaeobacter sp. 11ANDIMAR09]